MSEKETGVFAIVGDTGNPTGDEGSLHLLQELGYPFHDGKSDSVEKPEIVIRFYPNSNPTHRFFFTQAALDEAQRQHEKKVATIQDEVEALEERSRAEESRWEQERGRLDKALRRARD